MGSRTQAQGGNDRWLQSFRKNLVLEVELKGFLEVGKGLLGGLSLTFDGLKERDHMVIWTALQHGIPVAIVLAGGYALNVEDTVTIHANTVEAAREVMEKAPPFRPGGGRSA